VNQWSAIGMAWPTTPATLASTASFFPVQININGGFGTIDKFMWDNATAPFPYLNIPAAINVGDGGATDGNAIYNGFFDGYSGHGGPQTYISYYNNNSASTSYQDSYGLRISNSFTGVSVSLCAVNNNTGTGYISFPAYAAKFNGGGGTQVTFCTKDSTSSYEWAALYGGGAGTGVYMCITNSSGSWDLYMLSGKINYNPGAPSAWPAPPSDIWGALDDLASQTHTLVTTQNDYSPGLPGNWAGTPPTTIPEALDRLAAALVTLGVHP
jgi:hypothetical protein